MLLLPDLRYGFLNSETSYNFAYKVYVLSVATRHRETTQARKCRAAV